MVEDSGPPTAAVEIVTRSYAITGRCHGLTEYVRLIDLLNIPKVTHLQMSDVTVREFVGSREIIAGGGTYLVDKKDMIFGRTLESPEEEARRREARRAEVVEKAKHVMLVFASPFRILGDLHIFKDADFSIAVPRLLEGFLAITDAQIVHETESNAVWKNSFIVVNGRHVEMVCPSPPKDWSDPRGNSAETRPGAETPAPVE